MLAVLTDNQPEDESPDRHLGVPDLNANDGEDEHGHYEERSMSGVDAELLEMDTHRR